MLRRTLLAAAAVLLVAGTSLSANAANIVVYHGWSSPAEVASLNVLKAALAKKGDQWTDFAMFKYWSDPTMTPDQAISQLKSDYDTVFG